MVGHGNFSGAANRRSLADVHTRSLLFDYKVDPNGLPDWSNDQHMTLYADDENWAMMGLYDESDNGETGAFENEIMQFSTTDPLKFRRLLHHRAAIKYTTGTNGYWAIPKPTISRDGRFIAFTSNWEDSIGRYDLFIAKIDPPPPSTPPSGEVVWLKIRCRRERRRREMGKAGIGLVLIRLPIQARLQVNRQTFLVITNITSMGRRVR